MARFSTKPKALLRPFALGAADGDRQPATWLAEQHRKQAEPGSASHKH